MTTPAHTSGLVVVDKPEGPSSFAVIARLRKIMNTREVGHCGTLDPLASGVLVVAVGGYTRLVRVLTADDKRYTATISLGTSTTTDDREGETLARAEPDALHRITEAKVRAALEHMRGVQQQIPPAYSAIHVDGARAYERARRGEVVAMAPREVIIHALDLVSFEREAHELRLVVDVHCGKGTYVRSIARDLGVRLGAPAHLHALRRTASGAYSLDDAVRIDDMSPRSLMMGPSAVRGVPRIEVSADDARALRQGRRVRIMPQAMASGLDGGSTALAHLGEELVALVHLENQELVVERGFAGP